jgi:rubrerythrin
MKRTIDFGSLSLKDALDLAILIEEESQERYREFVDQMELHHTLDAAAFFRAMAGNEARHEASLRERRRVLFGDAPGRMSRSMLWDVEAPDYDQTRAFMSVRRAVEVALESEIKAYAFFERALNDISEPTVRELFEGLKEEELSHQELLRNQLSRLPDEPEVNPDDYADDPVAQ